jgi:hypothetical protein
MFGRAPPWPTDASVLVDRAREDIERAVVSEAL